MKLPEAKLDKANVEELSRLSSMQEGILFHHIADSGAALYHEHLSFGIRGYVELPLLRKAFELVIQANDILRSVFRWEHLDFPVRIVMKNFSPPYEWFDCTNIPAEARESELNSIKAQNNKAVLDLTSSPYRIEIIQWADHTVNVLFSYHHILLDGWSCSIILREWLDLYKQLCAQSAPYLRCKSSYRQYVDWLQTYRLESEHDQYWKEEVGPWAETALFPGSHRTCVEEVPGRCSFSYSTPETFSSQMDCFLQSRGITLASFVYCAWGLLLHRYTDSHRVMFGTVISGRPAHLPDIESIAGLFMNTVPFVFELGETTETVDELCRRVMLKLRQRSGHEWTPLVKIKSFAGREELPDLFESIIVVENYPIDEGFQNTGTESLFHSFELEESNHYDLTLKIIPFTGLQWQLEYNPQRFQSDEIQRISSHLFAVMQWMITNSERDVNSMEFLMEREIKILYSGPVHPVPFYPGTLMSEFLISVSRYAEREAMCSADTSLTYGQFYERISNLAEALVVEYNVQKGDVIAVMMNRSEVMLISIYAIMMAGAVYVPISPEDPYERVEYIINDSQATTLLFDESCREQMRDKLNQQLRMLAISTLTGKASAPFIPRCEPGDPAYIIYTSGSTGRPKGVVVEHRQVLHTLKDMQECYPVGMDDTLLFKTTFTFDVSLAEIFGWFWKGGRLAIASAEAVREPGGFLDLLDNYRVTHVHLVPSYLGVLLEFLEQREAVIPVHWRYIFAAGEALPLMLGRGVFEHLPKVRLINLYGPTEAAIYATIYEVKADVLQSNVPIGRPFPHCRAMVMDSHQRLVPAGVLGELWLCGQGIARGYIGQPEQTKARFVPNPLNQEERCYRTGDLVRMQADGQLVFVGRADHQVKVRGFRVELGEIESCALGLGGIQSVAATVKEDVAGHKSLVLYYVASEPLDDVIQMHLARFLPRYSLPSYYVVLDEMPVHENGKINRTALSGFAQRTAEDTGSERLIPDDEQEKILLKVWSEVLHPQGRISKHHDFFSLGGDSIKAMQIVSRVGKNGYTLKVLDVLHYPVLKECAQQMRLTRIPEQLMEYDGGLVRLTPIQRTYFEEMGGSEFFFCQGLVLQSAEAVEPKVLEEALNRLAAVHSAMRMEFKLEGDQIVQRIGSRQDHCPLKVTDISGLPVSIDALLQELAQDIHVWDGPLARAGLFRTGTCDFIGLVFHHLIIDGVSWRIIMEDLDAMINAVKADIHNELQAASVSFYSWTSRAEGHFDRETPENELLYWKNVSEDFTAETLQLPAGGIWSERSELTVQFSMGETRKLLHDVMENRRMKMDEFLLAALSRAHFLWSGRQTLWVDIEGHGRHEVISGIDVSRTVGWFTTIFPFMLEWGRGSGGYLEGLTQRLRNVPNHGIGYSWIKERFSPVLPGILFNYMGELDSLNASGLQLVPGSFQSLVHEEMPVRHALVMNSSIEQDRLVIRLNYSPNAGDVQVFSEHLKESCLHLCGAGNSAYPYPLSPAQMGLLLYKQLDEQSSVYMEQLCVHVAGTLDANTLENAYKKVIARHSILRNIFNYDEEDEPVQTTRDSMFYEFHLVDWSDMDSRPAELALTAFKETDRRRGFNLRMEPAIRTNIFKAGLEEYYILLSYHHIVMDGWSLAVVLEEWMQEYYQSGSMKELAVPAGYQRFVEWIGQQDHVQAKNHWKYYLAGYSGDGFLLSSNKRNSDKSGISEVERYTMDAVLSAGVHRLAEGARTSLSVAIQALWGIFLHKFTNRKDIVFGCVTTLRPSSGAFEKAVGHYSSALPVRLISEEGETYYQVAHKLQADLWNNQAFGFLPLYEMQVADVSGEWFDHTLSFDNYPISQEMLAKDQDLRVEHIEVTSRPHYPFNLMFELKDGSIAMNVVYHNGHFSKEEIDGIMTRFFIVIGKIAALPERPLSKLNLLNEVETQLMLESGMIHSPNRNGDYLLHRLFEESAARFPDNVALTYAGNHMNYSQLNDYAGQVVKQLLRQGMRQQTIVAICLERSFEMVAAIMAVLKAGGAYMPLDTEMPHARMKLMLEDSGAEIVLIHSSMSQRFGSEICQVHMDRLDSDSSCSESDCRAVDVVKEEDLAYLIYTSGSTGTPKGVMIEHRSIVNTISWRTRTYGFGPEDVILQLPSVSFDSSVEDIFSALSTGARLVLLPQESRMDLAYIRQTLLEEQVTHLLITPAFYRAMLYEIPDALSSLRSVTLAGEAFGEELVKRHYECLSHVQLYNEYGPTENSVCSTVYRFDQDWQEVLMGKPIDNVECLVVDRDINPLPVGITGELCVAGSGIARGYLHQPELTEECFISHPIFPEKTLYRTGDLVQWTSGGELRFIGRRDHEIKLRGIRFNPLELELKILEYPGITEAIVMKRQKAADSAILVAFIGTEEQIDKEKLEQWLAGYFPAALLPSSYSVMKRLPVNQNGKIDRSALEARVLPGAVSSGAALDPMEEEIIGIWKEVLQMREINPENNFFESGGNSILLTRVHLRIEARYPGVLRIVDLFEHPSVRHMAALLKKRINRPVLTWVNPMPEQWRERSAIPSRAEEYGKVIMDIGVDAVNGLNKYAAEGSHSLQSVLTVLFLTALHRSTGLDPLSFAYISQDRRIHGMTYRPLEAKGMLDAIRQSEHMYARMRNEEGTEWTQSIFQSSPEAGQFIPALVFGDTLPEWSRERLYFDLICCCTWEGEHGLQMIWLYNRERINSLVVNQVAAQCSYAVQRFALKNTGEKAGG